MAAIDGISDDDLRSELSRFGFNCGPITATTRKIYLKKLATFSGTAEIQNSNNGNVNGTRGSSIPPEDIQDEPAVQKISYPTLEATPEEHVDTVVDSGVEPEADESLEAEEFQESFRVLSPEEIKARRLTSPFNGRRRLIRSNRRYLQYVIAVGIPVIVAMIIAQQYFGLKLSA